LKNYCFSQNAEIPKMAAEGRIIPPPNQEKELELFKYFPNVMLLPLRMAIALNYFF